MLVTALRRLRRRRGQFALGGLGPCASPGATPCCGCAVTFKVICNGLNVNGAAVAVKSGSTTVAGGTTNSSGIVNLSIPSAGSYTVTASGGTCTVTYSALLSLSCGNTYTLPCCSLCTNCAWGALFPTIHITDSFTTVACPWQATHWQGCYSMSLGSNATDPCGCLNSAASAAGCVQVLYNVACTGGNVFQIQRFWEVCNTTCAYCCDTFTAPPNCSVVQVSCTGHAGTFDCGSNGTSVSDITNYPFTSCNPFPISTNLTLGTFIGGCGTVNSPLAAGITINP